MEADHEPNTAARLGAVPHTGLFSSIAWGRFEVIAVDECFEYGLKDDGQIYLNSSDGWTRLLPFPPGAEGRREAVKDLVPMVGNRYGDTWKHKLSPEYVPGVLALAAKQNAFLRACAVELEKESARLSAEVSKREVIWID